MQNLSLLSAGFYARNAFARLSAFAALLLALSVPVVLNAQEKPRIDVWLINTRSAPVCGDWEQGKACLRYWRLGENCQWNDATAASFAESGEKSTPTVFLIHGNRTSNCEAVEFAWPVYRWLYQQAGGRPYRVVIWSWPSDRTHRRNRPDVQTKACYCDSQSYYLADCLRSMKSDVPVSLIGYSFGARIITGGLELLGGGSVACHRLSDLPSAEGSEMVVRPIRAVLVAAAMDCFAINPSQAHGLASYQVEDMLATRNGCDRALRFYSRLYGRGGPEALGFVGPCCGCPANFRLFDVTGSTGRSHQWEDYIYCTGLFSLLPHYVFADEPTPTAL